MAKLIATFTMLATLTLITALMRISSGSNATVTARRALTSANGSTTSAKKPAGCSTDSKRRACMSARAASRCRSNAMTTIWRSQPKGAATCASWTAACRPAKTRKKAAQPRQSITPKHGRAETAAKLDLELVPPTANGNTFVLIFSGAPLPKAEAHDHRPVQVGKTSSHRRTRPRHFADALGGSLRVGSDPLRREGRRQRRAKI